MSDQEELRAVVRAIATMAPWDAGDTWPACFFCGVDQHDVATRGDGHASDCLWAHANVLSGTVSHLKTPEQAGQNV